MMIQKEPKTLLDHAGISHGPVTLQQAALLLIDYQKEYISGALPLQNGKQACLIASQLVELFRTAQAPIFHIHHHAKAGAALFNPETDMVAAAAGLTAREGEPIIVKSLPDAFAKTDLAMALAARNCTDLVIAGFMTHMCVASTTRTAGESGFRNLVIANACASRDLPHPTQPGAVVPADDVHLGALAALADRFAQIALFDKMLFRT